MPLRWRCIPGGGTCAAGRPSRRGHPDKVLAAMSGGVDSSVAARMVDAGHESECMAPPGPRLARCAPARGAGSSKEDAGTRAGHVLGIPFYALGFRREVQRGSINDSCRRMLAGNPEPVCGAISRSSLPLCPPAAALLTGHRPLRPAVAEAAPRRRPGQNQSYALAVLTAQQLRHAAFPIGDTKRQIQKRGGPPRPGGRQQAG